MSFLHRSTPHVCRTQIVTLAATLVATVSLLPLSLATAFAAEPPAKLNILFLGDGGHHKPNDRFNQLQPVLEKRGITLTYSEQATDLNPTTLSKYDGLMIYANSTKIEPDQEKALVEYVESGKGFIPLHCASYCFLNSQKYIDLVGAQFQKHQTGTFRVQQEKNDHPILKDYGGFESWDETYVHTKHNEKDRTVLEYRTEKEAREPWTWVRTQGKGRVFYTAWGHDQRTWSNAGFQNLVERGVRWACGQDPTLAGAFVDVKANDTNGSESSSASAPPEKPTMTAKRKDVKPFEFAEATVPFYPPNRKWGDQDGPLNKMQKPLDPAESQKHYVTPVGFEARLFVSEPDLPGKPIAMNWDERGRLWVAITIDYPNELKPEGQGRDKIIICEDTTGTGKADKITVFAENLSIPTSLIFANGGVIVHQAPQTLFLKSSKNDDHADIRKVLFSGWGTGDTHAGPSNLRYGLDNWIYGMVGYSGFNGDVGGEHHSFKQGFYRFRPDGSKMELLRNTNNNSWGVGFSEEGILFGSTANGNPSEYMPIPNRYYEAVRGWSSTVLGGISGTPNFEPVTDKIRQVDHHGRFTAAAGHALYTARNYPKNYWNRTAFVAEPTGHLLSTFEIQPVGANFRSKMSWNLAASDDEWSAPIMGEVGPDGNVWMIDWYNYIVQHNPTPQGFKTGKGGAYEIPLRDKTHGRIYRLVYTGKDGKEKSQPPMLENADLADLCSIMRHENMFWRLQAQRLLVERNQPQIAPLLLQMVDDPSVDSIGLNTGVIHALWALHGLGQMDGKNEAALAAAVKSLSHKSPGVRRAAVQVLPRTAQGLESLLKKSTVCKDADAQVRMATFLALSEMPDSNDLSAEIVRALGTEANTSDAYILDACTAAAGKHAIGVSNALAGSEAKGKLSVAALDRIAIVARHLGKAADPATVGAVVADLAKMEPAIAAVFLSGLEKGWPKGTKVQLTDEQDGALGSLLKTLPPESRGRLISLASRWGSMKLEKFGAEIATGFLATLQNEKASDNDRIAAADQLIEFRKNDDQAAAQILELFSPRTSPTMAKGFLDAVAKSESPKIGQALLSVAGNLSPANRAAALRMLLSRPQWTMALLEAAEKGTIQLSELSLDQREGLALNPDKAVQARAKKILAKGNDLPNADRQKVIDELKPLAEKIGDPVAGKEVFKKNCMKCHTHTGEGTRIGPDLTGMSVHPKAEFLIHIFDPSRSVEGNFRIYRVSTLGGKVYNGLLASETKTTVELIDAEAKKIVLDRDDVDQLIASNKSLMPEGFEKIIKPQEITDLLEFVTQRGKYVPLSLDRIATVVSTKGMFNSEDSSVERLIFPDWKPKMFNEVPFVLVDPDGGKMKNVVMLNSDKGTIPPKMPNSVKLACNTPVKSIHLLSGVSGWGAQSPEARGTVSMIVRLHYADGKTEDHPLKNGEHFADYIRRIDVPGSKFAFALRGQQIRYLTIDPKRTELIKDIEFVKGPDTSAPVVMAVTVETPEKGKE